MTTLLKDDTFVNLYDREEIQRPMTLDEYTHAQNMFIKFKELLAEFKKKSNNLEELMDYIRTIDKCGVRDFVDENDYEDSYPFAELEFNTGDTIIHYIIVTVCQSNGQLSLFDNFNVATFKQTYEWEYEGVIFKEQPTIILTTRQEVLKNIDQHYNRG